MPFRARRAPVLLYIHPKSVFTFTALFPVGYVIACCLPFVRARPDGVPSLCTIGELVSSLPRNRAFAIVVNLESLFIGICLLFREHFRHGKLSITSTLSVAAVAVLMSLAANISISAFRAGRAALPLVAAMSFVIYFRVSDANVCVPRAMWLSPLAVLAFSWVYFLTLWFDNTLLRSIGAAAEYIAAGAVLATLWWAREAIPDDHELIVTLADSLKSD
jgi:hypothetical protein